MQWRGTHPSLFFRYEGRCSLDICCPYKSINFRWVWTGEPWVTLCLDHQDRLVQKSMLRQIHWSFYWVWQNILLWLNDNAMGVMYHCIFWFQLHIAPGYDELELSQLHQLEFSCLYGSTLWDAYSNTCYLPSFSVLHVLRWQVEIALC